LRHVKKLEVILAPEVNKKAVRYTFSTIFEDFLGISIKINTEGEQQKEKENFLTIYYGTETADKNYNLIIQANRLWFKENYCKKNSLPKRPLKRYKGGELPIVIDEKELPIIYMGNEGKNQEPIIKQISEDKIKTNIDIISSVFFLLSGYQEYVDPQEDKHGRFSALKSLPFQEEFLDRPVVNEYIELLFHWLKVLNPKMEKESRKFQLMLTHDIDNIMIYTLRHKLRKIRQELIKGKSITGFFKLIGRLLHTTFMKNKNTINYILKKSKEFNFKSHFFFLTAGKNEKYDKGRYNIHSSKIKKIIHQIEKEGHKVNLHASYSSFLNKKQLLKEKQILEDLIKTKNFGVRWHYLRFKIPESYSLVNSCSFTYDSSLGYNDRYGFRAGTCYPFKPFNIATNEKMNFWEYPLIIMEETLINPNYCNMQSDKKIIELIKKIIDKIAFFNGNFIFLIHNTSLEDFIFPWRKIYEEILLYCNEKYSTVAPNTP
jgi:hypothetical protein